MPASQPTPGDLHVDALLSSLSVRFMNQPSVYIADQVFPIVPVRKQTDKYVLFDKHDFFRDAAQIRAPGEESTGTGYNVSFDNYRCENFATHVEITDEERANADAPFDVELEATDLVTDRLRLKREIKWATDFFKTGVWATDVVGGTDFTVWSDFATSTPIIDIDVGRDAIYDNTGREARDLVMNRGTWTTALKHHPDFIERIKFTQRAVITRELVASMLELDNVLIAQALKTTSAEGVAAGTLGHVFGEGAFLYHRPARAGMRRPSAGYTFHWSVFGGLSFMKRFRIDLRGVDRIEGHTFFDHKVVNSECGYFFSNTI